MSMNEDLKKYSLYCIGYNGELIPCTWIKTVDEDMVMEAKVETLCSRSY